MTIIYNLLFNRAHWHGELALRIIKPDLKQSEVEFLNQFRNQVN